MSTARRRWQRYFRSVQKRLVPGPRARQVILDAGVALSLAFLVWLYTRSRAQITLDNVDVPIQITLAAGAAGNWQMEVHGPARVSAFFSGPPSRIKELRQQLQRGLVQGNVTLNIPEEHQKDSVYRDVVRVEAEAIHVPPGVQTVMVEGRNLIPVTLHRLVERYLPVCLDYTGELRLSSCKIEPATVLVRGPKDVLDRARCINTQPFAPAVESESVSEVQTRTQVALLAEIEGHPVQCTPDTVLVRARLHSRQQIYELSEVPVHFLCPAGFAWRARFASPDAGRVNLKVLGPAGEEPPTVLAFVDLTHANLGRGRNVAPLRLQLPKDFQLLQEAPPLVAFYLEPIEISTGETPR